jgi:syntaxin-binding protein 1
MSKLGQHVAIASQCMDVFTKQGLMDISQVEQTISTGVTEDGTEIKGSKLVQMMQGVMSDRSVKRELKLRLLAIFYLTQKSVSSSDKQMLCQAAGLTGPEQQVLLNFNLLASDSTFSSSSSSGASGGAKEKGGLFSMFRSRATPQKHDATPEGEYSDTRHVCALKILLEQLIAGELPTERFPVTGPAQPTSDTVKTAAKSVRKFGANSRWGRKDQSQFTGGRYIVFCAGGITYSELRVGYECMQAHAKEVIIGGTHLLSPGDYMDEVGSLHQTGR